MSRGAAEEYLTPQSALLLFYYALRRHIFNNLSYTPVCFCANKLLIVQNGTIIVEYHIKRSFLSQHNQKYTTAWKHHANAVNTISRDTQADRLHGWIDFMDGV